MGEKPKLELRFGLYGALIILVVALALVIFSAANQAKIDGYVIAFLVALIVGVFLAKNQEQYGQALIEGLSRPMFSVIALAVLLAAISGQLISQSGMIQSIAHAAIAVGMTGKLFIAVTFVLTCLISFSTATSVGTYFVVIPILFPSGVLSGANPAFLIGAIGAGCAFGDNLAPISDTTIASSTSQEMDIGGVVSSRSRYSIPVAIIALIFYLIFGKNTAIVGSTEALHISIKPLLILIVPIVTIVLCLMRKHLITALSAGIVAGVIVGLIFGIFTPKMLLHFPAAFNIEGLFYAGITGALPTIAFLMVIFPFIGVMEASGALAVLGNSLSRFAKGPKSVETITVASVGLLSMITGVISVAIISVGDIVMNLGKKHGVDGYRRANLLDCAGVIFCFLAPWTVHAIVPSMLATANAPKELALHITPVTVPLHNFYSWVMLAMLIFAIITGYGRTWAQGKAVKSLQKVKEEV